MSKIRTNLQDGYGCEDKEYLVLFYSTPEERQERCGCTNKVYGIIENFIPHEQIAVKDFNGNLWLIDSHLIAIMRPLNDMERRSMRKDYERYVINNFKIKERRQI